MNKKRDELIKSLEMAISRRAMLKGMGYGLAGAVIAPSVIGNVWGATEKKPRLSLSDATPEVVWTYNTPVPTQVFSNNPVLGNGVMIVTTKDISTLTGFIYSVDMQTRQEKTLYSAIPGEFSKPLVAGDMIYVSNSGSYPTSILAINALTGGVAWQRGYSLASAELTLANGKIIFPTSDGEIIALDLNGNQVWSYSTGVSAYQSYVTNAIVVSGVVVVAIKDTLYGVDLQTGGSILKWNSCIAVNNQCTGTNVNNQLSVANGSVYFTSGGNMFAVDVSDGSITPFGLSNLTTLSSPVYYNGAVYAADSLGNFYAVRADTGDTLWTVGTHVGISEPIMIEDGIAYFASSEFPAKVYALDLASWGQRIVEFDPTTVDPDFSGARLGGVETGVCYCQIGYSSGSTSSMVAVNLANLIHQFFCESELMVEDFTAVPDPNNSGSKIAQGNTTSYRTHVQLFDPNKNPRANKPVKVWASGPVTITSGGQSYDIDVVTPGANPEKSAWLQTDGSGELSIVSTADSIVSPALYLWSNFMDLDEAIVIYPDHDTLTTLSNVDGSTLTAAKGYDKTPMLPDGYTKTEDLASTIRNTIGGAQTALDLTRKRHQQASARKRRKNHKRKLFATSLNAYIAYPDSAPNLLYQPIAGPADRTYASGAVPNWTAEFDSEGGVTFNSGVSAEPQLLGSFIGDLEKFAKDVVNTAVKVTKIVWSTIENGVQIIINEAGDFYQDTIKTLEHAAAVVTGILKTVINDIKKAVQWLSFLFDWDNMLATKDLLKGTVVQKITGLQTYVNNQINGDVQAIHDFFTKLENDAENNISTMVTKLSGKTLQSQQPNNNNPQTVYGAGGAKSYAKSRWMTSKYQDNASQGTVDPPASSGVGDAYDDFLQNIQQFATNVANAISNIPELQSLPTDLKNLITDFGLLVTNPSEFVNRTFGDILLLFYDIAVTFLKLADAVIENLLKLLGEFINDLLGMVNQTLHIPVISDLYSLITKGSPLTFLDLFCLIIAVPTTIIGKAINGSTQSEMAGANSVRALPLALIGAVVGGLIYASLETVLDLFEETPNITKQVYLASSLVIFGLGLADDIVNSSSPTYLYDAMQIIPNVATGVDLALTRVDADSPYQEFKTTWEGGVSKFISIFYGGVMEVWTASKSSYGELTTLDTIKNVLSFVPSCAKFLATGPDGSPTRITLGIIDFVGDITPQIITAAEEWNDVPS